MKCLYCTLDFDNCEDYNNHYVENHILQRATCYNCVSCNFSFITSADLQSHIINEHNFKLNESTLFRPERWGFKNLLVEL